MSQQKAVQAVSNAAGATALILTLRMDRAAAARYTALRTAHFPAERNWLDAHITLFHALPVASIDDVLGAVAELASTTTAFAMQVDRVLWLGQGVAYGVSSPQAVHLRQTLARRWQPLLGRQDRAWHGRLHITVQNKVQPATAKALHAQLLHDFVHEEIGAVGLDLWHYVGGPWRPAGTCSFGRPSAMG